jgi:predicted dehydrogenase
MTGAPVRVGVIGCGVISKAYLTRLATFPFLSVDAVADLVPERAAAKAAEHAIARSCSPDELLADPDIDLVVNLTIPAAHASIALAAIAAGKSVYSEKPLALTRAEGEAVLAAAAEAGVRVGCAPDTFLGAGLQTCRRLLDEGAIGEPLGVTGFFMGAGPEAWHPDPAFFYQQGAGPLFDVGVYYLTALVSLLGPVVRVSGSARISRAKRPIGSEPLRGQLIDVEVPTHISMTLDFASGPVGTVVASFDCQGTELPRMEVYGTEGTLSVPDPNTFVGPVRIRRTGEKEWSEVPLVDGYAEQARGIGAADMVLAGADGRAHRASGELALHVLDLMQSVHEASAEERYVRPVTSCNRPEPLTGPLT